MARPQTFPQMLGQTNGDPSGNSAVGTPQVSAPRLAGYAQGTPCTRKSISVVRSIIAGSPLASRDRNSRRTALWVSPTLIPTEQESGP